MFHFTCDAAFDKRDTAYPFFASPTRTELICNNYKKITIGMTPKDVKAILSAPDEIHPLYEPKMKNAKKSVIHTAMCSAVLLALEV